LLYNEFKTNQQQIEVMEYDPYIFGAT